MRQYGKCHAIVADYKKRKTSRTDTQRFRDERQLALGSDFDTKFSQFHNGTTFFTFLITLFGLALGSVDNGDTCQRVALFAAGGLLALFLGWHDYYSRKYSIYFVSLFLLYRHEQK